MTVDGGFAWSGIWVYLVAEVAGAVAAAAFASFAVPASRALRPTPLTRRVWRRIGCRPGASGGR